MAKYLSMALMVCASFALFLELGQATGACSPNAADGCVPAEAEPAPAQICDEAAACDEAAPAPPLTVPQGAAMPPLTAEDLRIAMPLNPVETPSSL